MISAPVAFKGFSRSYFSSLKHNVKKNETNVSSMNLSQIAVWFLSDIKFSLACSQAIWNAVSSLTQEPRSS